MVIPEKIGRWMDREGFRFQRLQIDGMDNETVLRANAPEMAREETCLFHRDVPDGDAYLNRFHDRLAAALTTPAPLPVVRFADGEYAFYGQSLECNGLYRQAESVQSIREALPFHVQAFERLLASGLAAPLVFPGNLTARAKGILSFFRKKELPSAGTFLSFLEANRLCLTGSNYLPFYAVYAYLTSGRFARLVHRRRVCILNADANEQAVERWFATFDSRPDLSFVELPPEYVATRWPRQREAVVPRIPADTELCIVGAGIGALPVCVDVATRRSIPALDAGHALNIMNDRVDKSNGARLYSLWKTP
jgi:hypothetical protein